MHDSQERFIRQQGFQTPRRDDAFYNALMFQPRVVGGILAAGMLSQNPWLFVALAALLAWSAAVPTRNPFDTVYNHLVAYPRGLAPVAVAPAPRRFAAALAATLFLVISTALVRGAATTAWILEAIVAGAVAAVIFGRFCTGSFLYHVLSDVRRIDSRHEGGSHVPVSH